MSSQLNNQNNKLKIDENVDEKQEGASKILGIIGFKITENPMYFEWVDYFNSVSQAEPVIQHMFWDRDVQKRVRAGVRLKMRYPGTYQDLKDTKTRPFTGMFQLDSNELTKDQIPGYFPVKSFIMGDSEKNLDNWPWLLRDFMFQSEQEHVSSIDGDNHLGISDFESGDPEHVLLSGFYISQDSKIVNIPSDLMDITIHIEKKYFPITVYKSKDGNTTVTVSSVIYRKSFPMLFRTAEIKKTLNKSAETEVLRLFVRQDFGDNYDQQVHMGRFSYSHIIPIGDCFFAEFNKKWDLGIFWQLFAEKYNPYKPIISLAPNKTIREDRDIEYDQTFDKLGESPAFTTLTDTYKKFWERRFQEKSLDKVFGLEVFTNPPETLASLLYHENIGF